MRSPTVTALGALAAVALAAPAQAAAPRTAYADLPVPLGAPSRALASASGPHVLAPLRAPFRFDLTGARWHARGTVSVELRVRAAASGRWSRWQAVEQIDPAPAEERDRTLVRSEPVWAKGSDAVQLRWRGPGRLLDATAAVVDGRRGPVPLARRSPARAPGAPPIVTRAEWGADERIRKGAPRRATSLSAMFVHHTATSNAYTPADGPAIVRSIYTYHVRSNGWSDVGYNYLVDAYGTVYEGRFGGVDRNVVGAHTLGFNTGTSSVAVIGNGSKRGLTTAARQALVDLLAWRLDLAHLDPQGTSRLVSSGNPRYRSGQGVTMRVVSGHRDGYPTECPGGLVYAALPGLAASVAKTGLPKIYTPSLSPVPPRTNADGTLGPVSFAARLAGAAAWTVKVLGRDGSTIASGSGKTSEVRWDWNGKRPSGAPVRLAEATGWRIDATAADGTAARPATGAWGAAPPVTTPPPAADIAVTPRTFSPNGDGTADVTRIRYRTDRAAIAQVSILDASGLVVATPSPSASLPAGDHVAVWGGLLADGVTPAPEGLYRAFVSTVDETGRTTTAVADVALTRMVGGLALGRAVASPNGDGRYDRVPIRWRQDIAGEVSVTITRRGAVVATVFSGVQPVGPAEISWDGTGASEALRAGPHVVVLRAQTAAGEQVMAKRLFLDLTAPRVRAASMRRWAGGGSLRLNLSEAAMVKVAAGSRTLVPFRPRRAGLNGFRWTAPGPGRRSVTVYAWDLAGNRMPPVTVRAATRR